MENDSAPVQAKNVTRAPLSLCNATKTSDPQNRTYDNTVLAGHLTVKEADVKTESREEHSPLVIHTSSFGRVLVMLVAG